MKKLGIRACDMKKLCLQALLLDVSELSQQYLRSISAVAVSQKYLGRASEISHYRRCKTRLGTGIATAYYYWRV